MQVKLVWLVLACAAVLQGCGARAVVAEPKAITLKAALTEVGEGLSEMVRAQPSGNEYGIYPAEVTVCFNVAATGTSSGALMVTPGYPTLTPATERVGAQIGASETATRANTITVRFVNVLFASQDTLVQHVTGAQLYDLRLAMLGIDPRSVLVPTSATISPTDPAHPDVHTVAGSEPAATGSDPPTETQRPAALSSTASTRAPDLPPIRFLSPFKPDTDPHDLIQVLTVEQLQCVANAVNERVGMTVVNPGAAEPDLRKGVNDASIKLSWDKASILKVLEKQKR